MELQIPRFARNDKGESGGEERVVAKGQGGCWGRKMTIVV